jgi:hypothetical protein
VCRADVSVRLGNMFITPPKQIMPIPPGLGGQVAALVSERCSAVGTRLAIVMPRRAS